jgi:hypothetical protein
LMGLMSLFFMFCLWAIYHHIKSKMIK